MLQSCDAALALSVAAAVDEVAQQQGKVDDDDEWS